MEGRRRGLQPRLMPGSLLAFLASVAKAGGWKNSCSGPGAPPGWLVYTLAQTSHHHFIWPPAQAVHCLPLLRSLSPSPNSMSPT